MPRQAKVGVVLADHLAAFRRAHRFSPFDKARGTVAPAGPRKPPYHFPPPADQSWHEAL